MEWLCFIHPAPMRSPLPRSPPPRPGLLSLSAALSLWTPTESKTPQLLMCLRERSVNYAPSKALSISPSASIDTITHRLSSSSLRNKSNYESNCTLSDECLLFINSVCSRLIYTGKADCRLLAGACRSAFVILSLFSGFVSCIEKIKSRTSIHYVFAGHFAHNVKYTETAS